MKRIILGALTLFMTCFAAYADEVPAAVTRQAAANFWNTYRTADTKPVDAADLQLMTYAGLEHLVVYANGEHGFVLMSADDNARPVLAYSFETPFPEELFPTLRFWLTGYESQIAEATEPSPQTKAEWETLLTGTVPPAPLTMLDVPKMVTTYWNQSDPYNRLCPYDSNYHTRTVVGCVATAMAQIMRYWRHPSCGVGSHCYNYYQYGTLCADFANTTYIWQYMPERVDAMSSREREINAVATLSYHCGVSVDMMYGPSATGGSGAYSHDVVTALTNYFRYDNTMEHHYRINYSDSLWRAKIDEDIEARRPVYYTGRDSSGGHAFVLDGSDTNGRYHFNLGWGGYGDGFYTIDNIAPGGGGAGGNATYTFNMAQSAIFGIKPVPQEFDTVDYYDTVCYTSMYYIFHEYYMPPTEGEYYLTYLDTVYHVQVAVAPKRFIHYDPNGADAATQTRDYCYLTGAVLSPNMFERPGYHFVGWCLDIDGHGELYQPGDTLHIRTTRIVYAIWAPGGVGIAETDTPGAISVWPNPTTGDFNIQLPADGSAQIRIFDVMGRTVYQNYTSGDRVKIASDSLPKGTYTIQVSTGTGIYNQRVIKR